MKREIWKDTHIPYYQVSNEGKIRSLERLVRHSLGGLKKVSPCERKIQTHKLGYKVIGLDKKYLIHRLVAIAFIPNPENKPQVNHKNGNKADNHVKNLEWVTSSENQQHSFRILGRPAVKANLGNLGEKTANAKRVALLNSKNKIEKVFGSCAEADRYIGSSVCKVSKVCRGQAKTVKGNRFKFISHKTFLKYKNDPTRN